MQTNNVGGPKAPPPPPPPKPKMLGTPIEKTVPAAKQAMAGDKMKHGLADAFGDAAAMPGKRTPVAWIPGLPTGALRILANTKATQNLLRQAATGSSSLRAIFQPQALSTVPKLTGLNRAAGVAGGVLAPFQIADSIATGGAAVQSFKDGNYGLGTAQAGQSVAQFAAGAAGAAGAARALGLAGRFSTAFGAAGRLAGPIGGVAAGIGGGIQLYQGLTADPPNVRQAALGGANLVGGGLLAAGAFFPPLAVAGGLVLLGTAVVEHWDTIKGAVGDAAEAVGDAVGEAAETVKEVGETVVEGAKEVGEAVVDTAKDVGNAVVDTVKDVGGAIADGAKKFFGGL